MISFSDVSGGFEGDGNFSADPFFAIGPWDDYSWDDFYLMHKEAGQEADSPCIDKGNDTAQNLGLDSRTTRTDNIPDSGTVDLGFHYSISDAPPEDYGPWPARWNVASFVEPCKLEALLTEMDLAA